MGTIAIILMLVLYLLMLAAGVYFKSYFDKKGANLATKEDFRELKMQTAELRQATKEIEAKVDDQMWNKQRQWEMKKEAVFAIMQSLSLANNALFEYATASFPAEIERDEFTRDHMKKKHDQLVSALDDLEHKRAMGLLVCSMTFTEMVDEIRRKMWKWIREIERDDAAYQKVSEQLMPLINAAFYYGRVELGTHTTSQSSESSAAPAPWITNP